MKVVPQRKLIRGLMAATGDLAQPPATVPRISNMLFSRRGSLSTCDGTALISQLNGVLHPISDMFGPITEIFLYQPPGGTSGYFAFQKTTSSRLGTPNGLAAGALIAGALTGAYKYIVTATDGAGGETPGSNEITVNPVAQNVPLSWNVVTNAAGYNIYRTVAGGGAGTEVLLTRVITNSYTDSAPDANLHPQYPVPTADTSQQMSFLPIKVPVSSLSDELAIFPADLPVWNADTPGGKGGSSGGQTTGGGGGGSPGGGGGTIAGGVSGTMQVIPQIIQFVGTLILLMGNGFPPFKSDGTLAGTVQLTNTFTSTYPAWQASTQYATNSLLASAGNIFQATQGGVSGAGAPVFPATLGQVVADGSVIWKNIGPVAASLPPRGAAHGIVYAGSLWVYNTNPTTTTDQQDGPSCLKMSDVNNPNSWNPLNVAFLGKDDGSQGTGLASFTIAEFGIAPTGSLIAFKDFQTYQIVGVFGATDFSIQLAQTDLGCVAPRTIQFIPGFGVARFTHLGIAVFDGVRDRLLSEDIRPYLFPDASTPDIAGIDWNYAYLSKGALVADPPMYVVAIPVIGRPSIPVLAGIAVAQQAVGACTLPPGQYYVRVAMVGPYTEVALSAEFGPITIDATHGFKVTGPPNPGGICGWEIFFGTSPGGESSVLTVDRIDTGFTVFSPDLVLTGGVPTYMRGLLTRLLCYDLVLKAWTVVDLPFPILTLKQMRAPGGQPMTIMTGVSDGGVRRWQYDDVTWDAGAVNAGAANNNVGWSVRTAEVFAKEASQRVYFRKLIVRGVSPGQLISAAITLQGVDGSTKTMTMYATGSDEFEAVFDIHATAIDAHATISGQGPMELESFDWFVNPRAVGTPIAV